MVGRRKRTYGPRPQAKRRAYSRSVKRSGFFLPSLGPKRFKVKLRFADVLTLDPSASGGAAEFVYQANGIFDPQLDGGVHQPRGFDQYIALWAQYAVTEAKITCHFAMPTGTTQPNVCGIAVADQAGTTTNLIALAEHYDVVTNVLDKSDTGQSLKLMKSVNVTEFLGRDSNITDDDDLLGNSTNNPAEGVFFHVFAAPMDPTADSGPILCYVYIDFVVEFIQHIRPGASDI